MKTRQTLINNIIYLIKNELPYCACGKCGLRVINKKNRFINGHNKLGKSWWKGKILSENHKLNLSKNHKGMLGKNHSEDSKNKISLKNNGKKRSKEIRNKMSVSWFEHSETHSFPPSQKGKKDSPETKLQKRISRKKYMEKHGMECFPFFGNNEKYILDQLQNNSNIELLRNDRNISKIIKGNSVDGYSPKYNLVVEVLESHHFNKQTGELIDYDLDRQAKIACYLGCIIYYVPEQEFLSNTKKEIQRFKNFVKLLQD